MNKMRSKREFSKEAISSTKLYTWLGNVFYSAFIKKDKIKFIPKKDGLIRPIIFNSPNDS